MLKIGDCYTVLAGSALAMPPKARGYFVDAWLVFVLASIYFRSVFP